MHKLFIPALALSLLFVSYNNVETAYAQTTPKTNLSPQEKKAIGVESVIQINPTTVEVHYTNGKQLTIDFYSEHIFRMFQDDVNPIIRFPQATPPANILVSNPRKAVSQLTISKQGDNMVIATSTITLTLNKHNGLINVINKLNGNIVIKDLTLAQMNEQGTMLTLQAQPNEYFFGGGVQNGRFSHKGKSIAIENTNNWVDGGVASPTPFYWSTNGYGILWHTFKPGRYDFGATHANQVILKHQEKYLDLFVMVNATPTGLLNDFYQLTGHPVLLPKFGFYEGHLNAYNRDYWKEDAKGILMPDGKRYKESQKDNGGIKESLNGEKNNYQFSARAAIDRYVKNDMPLGWFLPNDGYGAGYGQTKTLDGNIDNLKNFANYAHKHGVEIGLWTQSDLHPKAGIEALLQRDIIKEVRNAGVRVLKTDVAWVGNGYSFGLNGVADVAHVMPYYGNDARPFIISLDGWAGTQRYATIWSGDQTGGDWEYIRFHIPTFIGSGLSGQPNITSDLDGIFGGHNIPVNIREFQWKTFNPMGLNMDGWGSNPKYPDALGEPATSINRHYLKMKSMLMPYIYSVAHQAVNGKPIIRAMFLDEPNRYTLGTQTQYQFMYGPWFLVAPIYQDTQMDKNGNDIRNLIYLPEGKWIDFFNGNTYQGGKIINNFDAPIWKLPLFVKAGAIIPMTNANNNVSQIKKDLRIYEIYPQANAQSSFDEYDDDGKTMDYKRGKYVVTHIATTADDKGNVVVNIEPTKGNFAGFVPVKQTVVHFNVSKQPKKVTVKVGAQKVKLLVVNNEQDFNNNTNVCYYNAAPNLNLFASPNSELSKVKMVKNPQLWLKINKTNVAQNGMEIKLKGYEFNIHNHALSKKTGALTAPQLVENKKNVGAFTITPEWKKVDNADYYEIAFNGMTYSTIQQNKFTIDGLQPEQKYTFKIRAVNKDGKSDWAMHNASTKADPLQYAIKGIKAQTTCKNQSGQGVNKLFDFDEKTMWHSQWGKGEAIPCDLTLDLKSVNTLDKLVYMPREDAGNGTLLQGTVAYSTDRINWSNAKAFEWKQNGENKTIVFDEKPEARYIRLHLTKGVGNFASGREMYVFKVPGTASVLQGDINRDKFIDENDFTSYMNYTGLRKGDSDFDYIKIGDINNNGLIDAYDISCVSTELDGGVYNRNDKVKGSLVLVPNKKRYQAGDVLKITVKGKGLHYVNALSFALPYNNKDLEYVGTQLLNMKDMVNLTYDRLHTNGQKELTPTFVNRGNNFLLDEGDSNLFIITFRAKKAGCFNLKAINGLLVDRNLGSTSF